MLRFSKSDSDFQELYRTHAPGVRRALESMVANRSVAEELMQESFLKAWKGLSGFGFKSSFKTWLYQVAINTARDWLRTHKNKLTVEITDSPGAETYSPETRAIQEALLELEEASRELLILHYYEGFDLKEIGKILGIPEGTVKSRLHQAKAKLQPLLVSKGFHV